MPFLEAGPTRLFYVETGGGPLALFVHGGGLDHRMWERQLEGLADIRRCVAIDLPGHGRSGPGPVDLAAAIAGLGATQADLVGHSWGGHVVLAAWWRHPASLRSIALIGVMFSADARPPAGGAAPAAGAFSPRPVPIEAQETVVRSISVPFLVATGVDDRNTPAPLCRKLAETNHGAHFVEIAGAGHMAPGERPDQVNAALRSLW